MSLSTMYSCTHKLLSPFLASFNKYAFPFLISCSKLLFTSMTSIFYKLEILQAFKQMYKASQTLFGYSITSIHHGWLVSILVTITTTTRLNCRSLSTCSDEQNDDYVVLKSKYFSVKTGILILIVLIDSGKFKMY